jgi:excisionase family DNA binding protein
MALALKIEPSPADRSSVRPELEPALIQARTMDLEDLPRLLGELEQVRVTAMARLMRPEAQAPPDTSLGIDEAARRLGVSQDYLYRHWQEFKFARQEGRKILFSSNAIDAYLKTAR